MSPPKLEFREVDPRRWDDFARLFGSKGAPGYCWCMAWRPLPGRRDKADKATRRAEMKKIVAAGTPVGLLGYLDDEPVAWCSVAPKETYLPLGGPDPEPDEKVWSIACFFLRRDLRGEGQVRRMIEAAV